MKNEIHRNIEPPEYARSLAQVHSFANLISETLEPVGVLNQEVIEQERAGYVLGEIVLAAAQDALGLVPNGQPQELTAEKPASLDIQS